MLEDGLYILRCTVVDELGLRFSDNYIKWPTYTHRYNPDRAIRTRVRQGVVDIQGHAYLRHYQHYLTTKYDCYTFITELDQLRQGLLPYPERS